MSSTLVRVTLLIALTAAAAVRAEQAPGTAAPATRSANGATTAEQQTLAEQTTPPPAPPAPPLTLQDCIALAMKKNFDLQIQGFSVVQAKEALVVAQSTFDPTIVASAQRSVSQSASTTNRLDGTTLDGPRSDNTVYQVGVNERLPQTNGVLGLSANTTRGASNSANALLNPIFGNGVSATLSQPLLRNGGSTIARSQVRRNQIGVTIAYLGYRSRVLTVIRDTENAYYNLVAAREALRIRELSLDLAQKVLAENEARRATGLATDLDVATAQMSVANARGAVMQARQGARDAEDALLSLINVPDINVRAGPVSFGDYRGAVPSFAVAYKLARESYPDTLSIADQIKQLQIDLAVARNNRLPSLNLNASLGYTARATDQGYWTTMDNLPREHGNNWSVGLTYSIPWGRRADRANYLATLAGVNAEKARLEQLELQLLVDVRSAVRAVDTNLASVRILAEATQLASKQYDLQKARFDAGLSTSRLVLQAQDDLETARFNELNAKATLWSALAELRRLEGTSLERFHVALPR